MFFPSLCLFFFMSKLAEKSILSCHQWTNWDELHFKKFLNCIAGLNLVNIVICLFCWAQIFSWNMKGVHAPIMEPGMLSII